MDFSLDPQSSKGSWTFMTPSGFGPDSGAVSYPGELNLTTYEQWKRPKQCVLCQQVPCTMLISTQASNRNIPPSIPPSPSMATWEKREEGHLNSACRRKGIQQSSNYKEGSSLLDAFVLKIFILTLKTCGTLSKNFSAEKSKLKLDPWSYELFPVLWFLQLVKEKGWDLLVSHECLSSSISIKQKQKQICFKQNMLATEVFKNLIVIWLSYHMNSCMLLYFLGFR